jgi:hypothetical protein
MHLNIGAYFPLQSGDFHILLLVEFLNGLFLQFDPLQLFIAFGELFAGFIPVFAHFLHLLFIPIFPISEEVVGLHEFFE